MRNFVQGIYQLEVEELSLMGGGLPYLSDTSAGNLRVSSMWRDQVENKYMF